MTIEIAFIIDYLDVLRTTLASVKIEHETEPGRSGGSATLKIFYSSTESIYAYGEIKQRVIESLINVSQIYA